jgi:AcrR family transcriptional regulator
VAAILHAAVDALAEDREASMAENAKRAGVVRATIYVHFPTREALIESVTQNAIHEVTAVIEASEPDRGDPVDALRRVIGEAWRSLARYHPLIEINMRRARAELRGQHSPVLMVLEPLVKRGQAIGAFRDDVPATWHLSMMLSLIHAASGERHIGLNDDEIGLALSETIVGALA